MSSIPRREFELYDPVILAVETALQGIPEHHLSLASDPEEFADDLLRLRPGIGAGQHEGIASAFRYLALKEEVELQEAMPDSLRREMRRIGQTILADEVRLDEDFTVFERIASGRLLLRGADAVLTLTARQYVGAMYLGKRRLSYHEGLPVYVATVDPEGPSSWNYEYADVTFAPKVIGIYEEAPQVSDSAIHLAGWLPGVSPRDTDARLVRRIAELVKGNPTLQNVTDSA